MFQYPQIKICPRGECFNIPKMFTTLEISVGIYVPARKFYLRGDITNFYPFIKGSLE